MAVADDAQASSPTTLRILLGAQLRRLRESKGITREEAGYQIRGSESKISRLELGRVGFKERDVADLLVFYGVESQKERDAMLVLARQANEPGWWHQYSDVYPTWFYAYLGLESAASIIRTYEVQFVPGLLQTPEYARAMVLFGREARPEHEIDRRIELRMARQQILNRPNPPHLWAVIDEAALRRKIGGPAVMYGQLSKLLEASKHPAVTIQVIPTVHSGHAANCAFSLLRFPDKDLPDVVYLEQLTSALYLDRPSDVDEYAAMMERLCYEAAPPAETSRILEQIMRDLAA